MTQVFRVTAPLSGWVMPLAEIPDAVFARGMAGDGVAINPTGSVLHAPCSGVVLLNSKLAHAMTLRTEVGIELLMHIGIDTMLLKGQGFKALVADGDAVKAGQPLIEFDLDLIACNAVSAITPILLASPNARMTTRHENKSVAAGDALFEFELMASAEIDTASSGKLLKQKVIVTFDQGLHARPAALLAAVLRPFKTGVKLHFDNKTANAHSMVAVMSLGIRHLDAIEVEAAGPEAEAAMAAALEFFAVDAGQHAVDSARSAVIAPEPPQNGIIHAVIASRGLVIGRAFHLKPPILSVTEHGAGVDHEILALYAALNALKSHLSQSADGLSGEQQGIIQAHIELVQDPQLREDSEQLIRSGKSAGYAWQQATGAVIKALSVMNNAHMNARVADFRDVEQAMLKALSGHDLSAKQALPAQSIIIADELLPSQLMDLDIGNIAGICTSGGGPSAHAAIIAASMGIPFLVAAGAFIHSIAEGEPLILDAEHGQLHINASAESLQATAALIEQGKAQEAADLESALLPARTLDNTPVNVSANFGAASEVANALRQGAEGCGLFRTEFLFLDRRHAPSEEEQLTVYRQVQDQMGGKNLTIRTMDIGGDKPIPYLSLPKEENPALGLRGVRTSLWHEHLFIDQLRAILRLPHPGQIRILLPMVNDLTEVGLAKACITRCARDLGLSELPELGVMIETPASALLVDQLLDAVDFVSIGSNDLSQYVLAIDRGHPQLAAKLDALHPAVLRMIKQVAITGKFADKKVSLCGGLASDPTAIPILLGLGVLELSVVPAVIPRIKSLVRLFTLPACQELAEKSLYEKDAVSVRRLATAYIAQVERGGAPP